jgi:hypothetical protein
MSQADTTALVDVADDNSDVANGLTNDATDVTDWMTDVEARIAAINDALQALATSQSGASAPAALEGELFFDTDDNQWLGDPDGSGHDDEFATRLQAYLIDFATAGTATGRPWLLIHKDFVAVSKAGATGVLMTHTLPAGTLAIDNQVLRITAWGTKSGTTAAATIQSRFNAGAQASHVLSADCIAWSVERIITRTGAATQDFVSAMSLNRDDTGGTALVVVGTDAETLADALAIDFNVSSINAADTITQEGMIIEFGP